MAVADARLRHPPRARALLHAPGHRADAPHGVAAARVSAGAARVSGEPALEVHDLAVRFGGVAALGGVSFAVQPGTVTSLIGPNGAGKTTAFNVITGFQLPTAGRVTYGGDAITRWRPHRIAARGLVRTFQKTSLFPALTVIDNVMTGLHLRGRVGLAAALLRRRRVREEEQRARRRNAAGDRVRRSRREGRRARERAGLWRAAAARAGDRARRPPARAAARRARLRHDRRGEGDPGRAHPARSATTASPCSSSSTTCDW